MTPPCQIHGVKVNAPRAERVLRKVRDSMTVSANSMCRLGGHGAHGCPRYKAMSDYAMQMLHHLLHAYGSLPAPCGAS